MLSLFIKQILEILPILKELKTIIQFLLNIWYHNNGILLAVLTELLEMIKQKKICRSSFFELLQLTFRTIVLIT